MDFSEKMLEDIIYKALTKKELCSFINNNGLDCYYTPFVWRQPVLGAFGVADIVTFSIEFKKVTIYELKKGKIDLGVLVQAGKYLKAINKLIEKRLGSRYGKIDVEIYLIGDQMCINDWVYLFDGVIDKVSIYTYNFELTGLLFSLESPGNYSLVNDKLPI